MEHIQLEAEKDGKYWLTINSTLSANNLLIITHLAGKEFVVIFDFPGKDSIRYYNEVPVEKRVFKNLQLFMDKKQGGDDLFDRLNVSLSLSIEMLIALSIFLIQVFFNFYNFRHPFLTNI